MKLLFPWVVMLPWYVETMWWHWVWLVVFGPVFVSLWSVWVTLEGIMGVVLALYPFDDVVTRVRAEHIHQGDQRVQFWASFSTKFIVVTPIWDNDEEKWVAPTTVAIASKLVNTGVGDDSVVNMELRHFNPVVLQASDVERSVDVKEDEDASSSLLSFPARYRLQCAASLSCCRCQHTTAHSQSYSFGKMRPLVHIMHTDS